MTEIREKTAPPPASPPASVSVSLSRAVAEFVLQWGELGKQWGVSRSVAQIHALLYLSDHPLTAEAIAEALAMARSNVSTSLRELLEWRLVHRVPLMGDRREHFAAEQDIWAMVTRIAAGRKAREIDPAEAALKQCSALADGDASISDGARARLDAMLGFVTTMSSWHDQMMTVPTPVLMALIKTGTGVTKLAGLAGKRKE
ncbi:MAG: MarR family transcriptional regulator [Sphingopyxis sp.]